MERKLNRAVFSQRLSDSTVAFCAKMWKNIWYWQTCFYQMARMSQFGELPDKNGTLSSEFFEKKPKIANIWPKMFTSGNPAIWYHWNSVSTRVTRFVHFLSKNWRFWHFLKTFCQISTKTSSNSPNCDILAIWQKHVCLYSIMFNIGQIIFRWRRKFMVILTLLLRHWMQATQL